MAAVRISRLLRRYKSIPQPAAASRGYGHTATAMPATLGFVRKLLFGAAKPAAPRPATVSFARRYARWYHNPYKVAAAGTVAAASYAASLAPPDCEIEAVPFTDRRRQLTFSQSQERELGEVWFANAKEELDVLDPLHPRSVRVRRIASKIIDAIPRALAARNGRNQAQQLEHIDGIKWEAIVVKDDRYGAFCCPGGKLVVNTGLLDYFTTDAEIATVLGHEVGHAIARHSAETMTHKALLPILQNAIMQFVDMPHLIRTASTFLVTRPLSRKMEAEADYIAIMLLAAAGFDPHAAPAAHEKRARTTGHSALENYLSTHPSRKTRAELVSQDKVMEEAMELYRQAGAGRSHRNV